MCPRITLKMTHPPAKKRLRLDEIRYAVPVPVPSPLSISIQYYVPKLRFISHLKNYPDKSYYP